jgi:hypothetical protein
VQVVAGVKAPFVIGFTENVTVPPGVLAVPVSVSATVAVQVVPTPTWTELGAQLTVTLTVRLLTVRLKPVPLLLPA